MKKKNQFSSILMNGCLAFAILFFISVCKRSAEDQSVTAGIKGIHALLLVSENYGLNYFLMRDVFDQFGWKVTHTGVLESITA
ncbi:MAG: hypothetical protein OEW69_11670, partial [Nitrospirota bacterium]|nr:hypothetical protein [Nitrospirota bacterium]